MPVIYYYLSRAVFKGYSSSSIYLVTLIILIFLFFLILFFHLFIISNLINFFLVFRKYKFPFAYTSHYCFDIVHNCFLYIFIAYSNVLFIFFFILSLNSDPTSFMFYICISFETLDLFNEKLIIFLFGIIYLFF